jgi:galactokinase
MTSPELADRFRRRRHEEPAFWALAPGRVNLIGEHTDYNEGYVLPAAIDRYVALVGRPQAGTRCRLFSEALGEDADFDLASLEPGSVEGFGRYGAGIAWALAAELGGRILTAIDADVYSTLPVAAGVSSSAAFEVAFAVLWNELDGLGLDPVRLAQVAQKAENRFVGLKCGIMDQMAAACGKQGNCLLIDTRSLKIRPVRIPPDLAIVVCDTGKARGLTDSAYNERWEQCREAAGALGVSSLRDATRQQLEERRADLPSRVYRRALHVVTENDRVLRFVEALETADQAAIGGLMAASHRSLRDHYEVSSPELDAMVAAARVAPGCVGVRMTGAGFGGCCVALVDRASSDDFVEVARIGYERSTGLEPRFLVCEASRGAQCGRYPREG